MDGGELQDVKESALLPLERDSFNRRDAAQSRTVLVTGAAGFIGFHTALKLAREQSTRIVSFDVVNDYYDVSLKHARMIILLKQTPIEIIQGGKKCFLSLHIW